MSQDRSASDEGAFSFAPGIDSQKLRDVLRGLEFRTTKILLRARREPADWSGGFLMAIHREMFGTFFPELAGRCRAGEALFGTRAGPAPERLESLLQQLVVNIRAHLEEARAQTEPTARLDIAFMHAARDHAEMVRIHPFVDGNGRWARIVTTLFLSDCGYPVGSIIRGTQKRAYISALDRCIDNGAPGDLANHLLRGYIEAMKRRT